MTGSVSLDDLAERTTCALPRDRSRTVAGLLFDALARRPVPGGVVNVAGTELRVESTDGHRITRMRITSNRVPPKR